MSDYIDRPIAVKPTATKEQAIAWAKKNGAAQVMIDLAPAFWATASAVGINPVFSYCQTAYETAYMTFRGTLLDTTYKNTAGIKRTDEEIKKIMAEKYPDATSSDDIAECHMKFNSWEDSIKAQVDHSALYAGLSGYPKKYPEETNDPRHFDWCFGIGKTVLTWATYYSTNSYGERLLEMMAELESMPVSADVAYVNITLAQLKSGMYKASPYTKQVKAMQQLLIANGFPCGPAGADGNFGTTTEEAVKAFQRSLGKPDSGVCGIGTWSALLGI
ncbi:MAG: peptidoglycan-binding protein [Clostridia bacterium]|nr:peptidoglycan-binding protein [Clostridia bacterium]